MGGHKEREATIARAAGKQSVRQRCPKCKKLRAKWFRANAFHEGRQPWERIEEGKSRVCHICVARHRGEPIPVMHGSPPKQKKVRWSRQQPPQP